MVMTTKEKTVTAAEVSLTTKDRCLAETALITLAEVAAASEKVEVEVYISSFNFLLHACDGIMILSPKIYSTRKLLKFHDCALSIVAAITDY